MRFGRPLALLLGATVLLGTGCSGEESRYEVAMTLSEAGIERRVSVISNVSPEEFNRDGLEAVYGPADSLTSVGDRPGRWRASHPSKRFDGALPADVGGTGGFVRINSPLGTALMYHESFGASVAVHESLSAAIDTIHRRAQALFDELDPVLDSLNVDPQVRVAARERLSSLAADGLLYSWSYSLFGKPSDESIPEEALMAFLCERGILTPDQVVAAAVLEEAERADSSGGSSAPGDLAEGLFSDGVNAWLNRLFGVPHPRGWETVIDELWGWDEGPESILDRFLWPDGSVPWLDVALAHQDGRKPLHSNGVWDEAGSLIRWHDIRPARAGFSEAPRWLSAVWVEADSVTQGNALGGVRLGGGELLAFIEAYHAADPPRQDEVARLLGDGAGGRRRVTPEDLYRVLGVIEED